MHFQIFKTSFVIAISRRRPPRHTTRTCFDTTHYPIHKLYIHIYVNYYNERDKGKRFLWFERDNEKRFLWFGRDKGKGVTCSGVWGLGATTD